jgi:hypothetical protein
MFRYYSAWGFLSRYWYDIFGQVCVGSLVQADILL